MGRLLGQRKNRDMYKVFNRASQLTQIQANNKTFFDLDIDTTNIVDFKANVDYKLDNEHWFYIDYTTCTDDIKKYIQEFYNTFKSPGKLADLTKDDLSELLFLIYGNLESAKWKLNFQVITKGSHILSRSILGFHSKKLSYEHHTDKLDFKDFVDIHIDEKETRIYFKQFYNIKNIHRDFILLYADASKKEIDGFVIDINKSSLFTISKKIKPKERNLKKIKLLLDSGRMSILTKASEITDYITKYSINLQMVGTKYIVDDNQSLTELVKILEESYYESEITKEKRETNSSKKL